MNWGTSGTVFQKGGGTNPFSTFATDPNTGKFPIWYATGRAGIDGIATVGLTNGFTASSGSPLIMYIWEYNRSAAAWLKIGGAVAEYGHNFDATYGLYSFTVSENAYVLVQSSAAITGLAYTDMMVDFNQVGAPQEGF
jgi:hypothetical protein